MHLDVFAWYRPGPGPSSARTVGPMLAARRFVHALAADGVLPRVARVQVELFGGLACTGRDLGTDRAIIAGLAGLAPEQCDTSTIDRCVARVFADHALSLQSAAALRFVPSRDILYRVDRTLPYDGNALRFVAADDRDVVLAAQTYLSTGNGDVLAEHELDAARAQVRVPYPYHDVETFVQAGRHHGKRIGAVAMANASVTRSPGEVRALLVHCGQAMRAAIERGLATTSPLPGGALRRAPAHAEALRATGAPASQWCAVYATAVAEENAAGGRIVGAPSSGSAGPVAALLHRWREESPLAGDDAVVEFLVSAAAVGALLRALGLRHAGCQSEVGLAAAMAAAGFVAVRGGSNAQVLQAAELALEPHVGLACDPDGARIQQPCIERNAGAAAHAHAAAVEALRRPMPRLAIELLVRSMVERGRRMAGQYKQASLGGLAINVADC